MVIFDAYAISSILLGIFLILWQILSFCKKQMLLSVIGVTAAGKYFGGYNELILFRKC